MKKQTKENNQPIHFMNNQNETAINNFIEISKVLYELKKTDSFFNDKQLNPFILWYSPRKNGFSAHLVGFKISAEHFHDLMNLCYEKMLELYNDWAISNGIIGSPVNKLNDVVFYTPYSKMSKDKLISEIELLKAKFEELNKKIENVQAEKNTPRKGIKSKAVTLAN